MINIFSERYIWIERKIFMYIYICIHSQEEINNWKKNRTGHADVLRCWNSHYRWTHASSFLVVLKIFFLKAFPTLVSMHCTNNARMLALLTQSRHATLDMQAEFKRMNPVCWQIISLDLTKDKHGYICSGLELVQPRLHIYCDTMLTRNPFSWLALNGGVGASLYLTQVSLPFRGWISWAAHRLGKNKSSMRL